VQYDPTEVAHPWRGGIAGLLKVAAKEWPEHLFRAIDCDLSPPASAVLRELVVTGPVEIGYRASNRLTVIAGKSEPVVALDNSSRPISSKSVVLVTGGGQGITAQVVQEIAAHVPATFILLGRSEIPAVSEPADTARLSSDVQLRSAIVSSWKASGRALNIAEVERELSRLKSGRAIRATIEALTAAGARAEYVSCDVRDASALAKVVADAEARYGKIDAMVHGAGILRDQLIADKNPDAFEQVIATKVDSLLHVLHAVDPNQLRLVVLFASISGFFGNTGQCDYAAANEILNRCARRLQLGYAAKVVALNWGPWAEVGMVTPEVAKKMHSNGVKLISPRAGRNAAWHEMVANRNDGVRSILGFGPWMESSATDQNFRRVAGNEKRSLRLTSALLAGHHVELHSDGSVTANILLVPQRQKLLSDHCIDGKPVLALAVALELMVETAAASQGARYPISVEALRMLSGIVVEGQEREVLVQSEVQERTPDFDSYRVQITAPGSSRKLYQALVRFSRENLVPPTLADLSTISRPAEISAAQAFEDCLFHGPTFRVVDEIVHSAEEGIDAVVHPSDPTECVGPGAGGWLVDPLVVDAGPQLALIWSQLFRDTVMLPTRVARYTSFAPLGFGPLEMYLRIHDAKDSSAYRADVWVVRDGTVLSHMEGLEGVGSSQLNRITASNSR
jgi:NAD(P)-dependent dehydrogenase (short-subunit alcohol dehydrogenase family)